MKHANFMEKRIDPLLRMALTDLARTLANKEDLDVDFAYHSYYDPAQNRVTVSFYWDRLLDVRKVDGMKTDIYLRAFGQVLFTDSSVIDKLLMSAPSTNTPSFFKQLTAMFEEFRVMERCITHRPGMLEPFQNRNDLMYRYYRERYDYHFSRQDWLDALFCAFYLRLVGRPVTLTGPLKILTEQLKQTITAHHSLESTEQTVQLAGSFVSALPDDVKDMRASFYTLRQSESRAQSKVIEKEANELSNKKSKEIEEEKETYDEKMPTWHQEQEQEGNNFLQFDLDEGAKTDLLGAGERKMESGDQAFASVQGTSQTNDGHQFDETPSLNENSQREPTASGQGSGSGVNRGAKAFVAPIRPPSIDEKRKYTEMKAQVEPSVRSLKRSLEKMLEHKQTAPRSGMHVGRLGKKLIHIATDDIPRLFYKKRAEDKTFDATLSLLVDCSASMHDKMENVHLGLTLFHESLRALSITHAVTGFWEDALASDDNEQPNYFLPVIEFERSLLPGFGASLLQLEPQEDNRDGFAIRKAVEPLLKRHEKHKWLLVFTDGEPSAFAYSDRGIIDTHEAVREARKKGIQVVGVFLSDGVAREQEMATMREIYGRESLVIPSVEDIPAFITPMLRKLLTSSGMLS